MIIVICFMAVTSSGASEMLAVSSLFTFDIYRRYIDPKARHIRLYNLAWNLGDARLHGASEQPLCMTGSCRRPLAW
jgi:hypothetical protein